MSNVIALKPAKARPTAEWKIISPAVATKLLESNTRNRSLSQTLIDRYAKEMEKGTWDQDNGETIKISPDGLIIDGQHRLWAVIESGTTLKFLVVSDVDPDSFKTIDIGKMRSLGDVAGIAGIANANQITSAATLILVYKKKKLSYELSKLAKLTTRTDVLKFCLENNEALQHAKHQVDSGSVAIIGSVAAAVGLYYLFCATSKTENKQALADKFFEQLGSGLFDDAPNPAKHPVRVLREKLIANHNSVSKMPVGARAALIIKAWNIYIAGRSVSRLSLTNGEQYPVIA